MTGPLSANQLYRFCIVLFEAVLMQIQLHVLVAPHAFSCVRFQLAITCTGAAMWITHALFHTMHVVFSCSGLSVQVLECFFYMF